MPGFSWRSSRRPECPFDRKCNESEPQNHRRKYLMRRKCDFCNCSANGPWLRSPSSRGALENNGLPLYVVVIVQQTQGSFQAHSEPRNLATLTRTWNDVGFEHSMPATDICTSSRIQGRSSLTLTLTVLGISMKFSFRFSHKGVWEWQALGTR
ncbi:uncharacterized protein EV422DRAFT_196688 [Fimicolochytrium jonesii]|uniref:uncharacterized protein n=1 Tax=Fimicolochytrium jonesii TaxID=1396493 RepID=UPI0022FDF247|nr:uncharacterized protein EV422DRAFT_196688 [Fimicolochytrium jonesii]KAI8818270.1 hypothetical protein EV422DRAFT_196688 [Fimicolochytrium jonesii]